MLGKNQKNKFSYQGKNMFIVSQTMINHTFTLTLVFSFVILKFQKYYQIYRKMDTTFGQVTSYLNRDPNYAW